MSELDGAPERRAKHLLPSTAISSVTIPGFVPHGGPTRKGHSNGLRVHGTIFAALSLAVLTALVAVFVIITGTSR